MEKKLNFNHNINDKCYYSDNETNTTSKLLVEITKNNNKRANSYCSQDYF